MNRSPCIVLHSCKYREFTMKENYDIGTANFVVPLQTNVALQHVSYFKEKPTAHILSYGFIKKL